MAKIMVVDDDRNIRKLFSMELTEMSHEVIAGGSCTNLMREIKTYRPDLIILEVKLDCCDGLELLQKIRDYDANQSVILCSASEFYRYDIKATAADCFVTKSCDLTELKTMIDRPLEAQAHFSANQ